MPVDDMGALGEVVEGPRRRPGRRRPGQRVHLAVDAPAAARTGRVPPLDADLRQRPSPGRTTGQPAERTGGRGRCDDDDGDDGDGPGRRASAHLQRVDGPVRRRRGWSSSRPTTVRCRASGGCRSRTSSSGAAAGPGGHQLARARHRHGRGRPGRPGRVAGVGGVGSPAHRAGRAPGGCAQPRAASSPSTGPTCVEAAVVVQRMHEGLIEPTRSRPTRSTCWPSRSWRRARSTTGRSTTCAALVRGRGQLHGR